jgi:very-short-patch-repair endonuclease
MKLNIKTFAIFVMLVNNAYANNQIHNLRYTSRAVAISLPVSVVDKPSACAGFFVMRKFKYLVNTSLESFIEKPLPVRRFRKRAEKKTSMGERLVADWLIKNSIRFKREKEFADLINPATGKILSIDFYLHTHKICIEFDGRQHFKASKLFDRNGDSLEARIQRDRVKDAYCRNRGIKMIRIRYSDINRVSEILSQHFSI